MTRAFAERVIRELLVDTRSYRYIRRVSNKGNIYIMRLPKKDLNTVRALDSWEVVYVDRAPDA